MKPCTREPFGEQRARHLSRAEAVRIGAAALEEQLQQPEQSYEGMAAAVVDALHHLGVLPLAEQDVLS